MLKRSVFSFAHPAGGAVVSDFQMILSNPNSLGIVYYTLDGSDPHVSSPPGSSLVLVRESGTKKVLVPGGYRSSMVRAPGSCYDVPDERHRTTEADIPIV